MTRKVLRLLGSRYGIAAILLLAVIAVVVIAKSTGDPTPNDSLNDNPGDSSSVSSGAPNDGMEDPTSSAEPAKLPADAVDNAKAFTGEYIKTDRSQKAWLAGIGPYLTAKTKKELQQTDPSRVPIRKIKGEPRSSGNNVNFETDAGLLILRMVKQNGKWLVDGIDFSNR